jgi:hypothetical protein
MHNPTKASIKADAERLFPFNATLIKARSPVLLIPLMTPVSTANNTYRRE